MNILVLTNNFFPFSRGVGGGIESFLMQMFDNYTTDDLTFLTTSDSTINDKKVIKVDMTSKSKYLENSVNLRGYSARFNDAFVELIKTLEKPDLVYSNLILNKYVYKLLNDQWPNIKIIQMHHASIETRFESITMKDIIEISDKFNVEHVAISEFVKQRINEHFNAGIKRIVYPVCYKENYFPYKNKKEEYYVNASRIVDDKEIDNLVDIFLKTPTKQLILIGEVPAASNKEWAEENVFKKIKGCKNIKWVGQKSHDETVELISKAKAYVSLNFSHYEGFGLSLFEAQCCNVPVITTKISSSASDGSLTYMIPGKTGLEIDIQRLSLSIKYDKIISMLDELPSVAENEKYYEEIRNMSTSEHFVKFFKESL